MALANERLGHVQFKREEGSSFVLVVPAKHQEVGDLRIYDEGSELRISFGRLTHSHIQIWDSDEKTPEEQVRDAAEEAVTYVVDVLSDSRLVRVKYVNGQWRGSTCGPKTSFSEPLHPDEKEYLWSGPVR